MTKAKFQLIPLSFILESQSNPRKRFDEEALQELANSIKEQGVVQPIVVREFEDRFEIVCGARRLRASQMAGLNEIPAIVRELSDDQAFELQITENLQRQDVHPLEEADAICTMRERGYSTSEIAERLGKSESFVLRRSKLNDLIPEMKDVFFAGKMLATQAKLLSRISAEDQMEIYNDDFDGWESDDFDPTDLNLDWSIRNSTRKLSDAPFDITDAELVPSAGACTSCPFNTAVNTLLFPDMADDARCSNRNCYESKELASVEDVIQQMIQDSTLIPICCYTTDEIILNRLKELGLPKPLKISEYKAVKAPTPPEAIPTIEQLMAEDDELTKEQAEEQYKWALEEYNDDYTEYQRDFEEYEELRKIEDKVFGLYVGRGSSFGEKFEIVLHSSNKKGAATPNPRAENQELEAARVELSGLEAREKRAKELDAEKLHRIMVDKLKQLDEYNEKNPKQSDLYETEGKALGYFLFQNASYEVKEKIRKQFKISHSDQYSGNKEANIIISQMTDEMFGMLARSAMMKAWEASASSAHNNGFALRQIIDFDHGSDIQPNEVENEYEATIEKRLIKYNERKVILENKIIELSKDAKSSKKVSKKLKK